MLAGAACAHAFEVQHAQAQFIEREYRLEMTALLQAPIDAVERVLRDYAGYTTLDPRILEAQVLERPEQNVTILATKLRACFGLVCRTVHRVERVEESVHALLAITDPQRSDMKFGETHTQLAEETPERTRVTYRTRLKPDFWVPAFFARRLMLKTLQEATIELFRRVEQQAQTQSEAPVR